jgi:hypothetical protein
MDLALKEKWIADLESGNFQQGKCFLKAKKIEKDTVL